MTTTPLSQVSQSILTAITTSRQDFFNGSSIRSSLSLRSYRSCLEPARAQASISGWQSADPTKRNKSIITRASLKELVSVVDERKVKEKMVFYIHEIRSADMTATLKVASLPENTAPLQWGSILVFDNEVREGEGTDSKLIARERGWGCITDKDSADGLQLFSKITFTDGKYEGSSLTFSGNVGGAATPYELIILGGTGHFRGAHGFVLADNCPNQGNLFIFQWNVFVTKDNVGLL